MSVKAVREYHGKKMLIKQLLAEGAPGTSEYLGVAVTSEVLDSTKNQTWDSIEQDNAWMMAEGQKLVAKPDQLIKRRGKAGLLAVNKDYKEAKEWITERMCKDVAVESVTGQLTNFLIEPMCKHEQADEYYVCIQSHRYFDEIYFTHEGGVDVGDVDAKALRLKVETDCKTNAEEISKTLLVNIPEARKSTLAAYLDKLYIVYSKMHFAYLEINPLVMLADNTIHVLDLAAKVDETASFLAGKLWGADIDFPAPFGRAEYPEEAYIRQLDAKTGASLKLTILNIKGRVWTMVAGGGASVVYSDTIADYGFGHELANYGEYSGAPTGEETFLYASTLLKLMTRYPHEEGKVLILGGGIANFTDVAGTFGGFIKAVDAYKDELIKQNIRIWVRRAGLNYLEGLRKVKEQVAAMGIKIWVYGPETHITAVVPYALGVKEPAEEPDLYSEEAPKKKITKANSMKFKDPVKTEPDGQVKGDAQNHPQATAADKLSAAIVNSTPETTSIVFNLQTGAVQRMLDFDHMCKRKTPSVAALIYPFGGQTNIKVYWGPQEIFIPVYKSIKEAVKAHPDVKIMVNFASMRSVYESTMQCLEESATIKTIAIIAEGVPEQQTRSIIKTAEAKGVGLIGPATVGGIKPGCFRVGNTGGALENIIMSKLYRPGSVAYVSKSGGMSNELNNICCRFADGVCEGVAIGGDRYPGSRFIDHLLRYQNNPDVKILLLLGEVGGVDEYEVMEAVKNKKITKPLVAWCVGTCASCFSTEVQFGHAGAQARGDMETAAAKNKAMKEAGIIVPANFDAIPDELNKVYMGMLSSGAIEDKDEPEVPVVPKDYAALQKQGLVRKPANFVCSISDDRGEELKYCGMKISDCISENIGIGGVLSLLWFRRLLPKKYTDFIEMCIMITADHGPAVSGAHNTIVSARAGKDLVSSLCSGLLTIGPRFGGALDDAAAMFAEASDSKINAKEWVDLMKKQNKLLMGIGHRIKSKTNPDMRVELVKGYAQKNFPQTPVLDFALAVEDVTTSKKANLILNVDGCIAVCFVDMVRSCGAFSALEADAMVKYGVLNGLFTISRAIGFVGHYLDQVRHAQGLYRHPWDDIVYM